jgi:phosphoribosylformylglycinamidine cyclo-ligase
MNSHDKKPSLTYADSGVDVAAGEAAVDRIKSLAASTFNKQVLTGLGSFGGMFAPDFSSVNTPVMISSSDSVGTKVKLAFMTGIHNTVGEDLVNHCVNDILVHGAKPLFFLDYIGIDKLDPEVVAGLVEGLSRGCRNVGCALVGGETAELPGFYQPGEYDLVGFIVGMVDKNKIINGSTIEPGDVCIGLASNGLHTNGYTLARKVAFDVAGLQPDDRVDELDSTIAEALMAVHKCYATPIFKMIDEGYDIHGMAHITGGGIPGNLKRILPEHCHAVINKSSWPSLPLFDWLAKAGNIDPIDIWSAFNMGIGYIVVVPPDAAESMTAALNACGEDAYIIGEIKAGGSGVELV